MPVSTPTPEMHGGNFARKGFPTARLPERGLRDNQDTTPHGDFFSRAVFFEAR